MLLYDVPPEKAGPASACMFFLRRRRAERLRWALHITLKFWGKKRWAGLNAQRLENLALQLARHPPPREENKKHSVVLVPPGKRGNEVHKQGVVCFKFSAAGGAHVPRQMRQNVGAEMSIIPKNFLANWALEGGHSLTPPPRPSASPFP